ncbi:MAG: helix-turn-helix domain-containing protein [Elusimicrobia bacterium]|nr:helix-turn-helix domain-containing protein [Elusimicrobiota bacterium]
MKKKIKAGIPLSEVLRKDLKDPVFRKAFDEADIEARLAVQIALARDRAHMSQVQLAKKLGTKQQTISRIERGGQNLTLHTLWKISQAVKSKLIIELRPER